MQETRKQSLKQLVEIALDEDEAPNGVFDSKAFWVSEEKDWWAKGLTYNPSEDPDFDESEYEKAIIALWNGEEIPDEINVSSSAC